MTMNFEREVEERLLRYVQIDTTADESSPTSPSTERQYDLLNLLVDELTAIGAQDVRLTDYGAVLATIPATVDNDAPVIALLAHVDTSPAYSGANVKPLVHRNYQGGDIPLPDDPEQVLTYENSPYLKERIGDDIVTASGTTLLGADDKAGVAIVMAMPPATCCNHPHIPHGPIRIGFTPDEEIGRGVHANLPADLGADVRLHPRRGRTAGNWSTRAFSADRGRSSIVQGVSIHPGWAKDQAGQRAPSGGQRS
jgi:tripeptide aminopeptidase